MPERAVPRDAIRGRSLASSLAFVVGLQLLIPDAAQRGDIEFRVVATLGYGHLLGSLGFAAARRARLAASGSPLSRGAGFAPFKLVSLLVLMSAYCALLRIEPAVVLPFLGLSAWHTFENDLARVPGRTSSLRLAALSRRAQPQLFALMATLIVLGLVLAAGDADSFRGSFEALGLPLPEPASLRFVCAGVGAMLLFRSGPLLSLGAVLILGAFVAARAPAPGYSVTDVVALVTLYHLSSWLFVIRERLGALRSRADLAELRRLRVGLAWVHGIPGVVCLAVWLLPAPGLAPLGDFLFSPGLYLFWSGVHVVQTAVARGLEPGSRSELCRALTCLLAKSN